MRKTYAYNSIIVGALVGVIVYASTDGSVALALLATIAVSVVGFIIIKAIENVIAKGYEAASDATVKFIQKKLDSKSEEDKK